MIIDVQLVRRTNSQSARVSLFSQESPAKTTNRNAVQTQRLSHVASLRLTDHDGETPHIEIIQRQHVLQLQLRGNGVRSSPTLW